MRYGSIERIAEPRRSLASAQRLVQAYEVREVADHAFFRDLARKPVDLSAVWVLMANLREGISGHFVSWLAYTVARVGDRRIASLLAKQLNDELGNGDVHEIHSVLLDRFIVGLEPWRPSAVDDGPLLRAGRELAQAGAQPFAATNIYEAVGALMVGEIFAKKMDKCLADEVRRQNDVPAEALKWLMIHETLEVEHADDSGQLADLVPERDEALRALWRGAEYQWETLWRFLNGVQEATEICAPRQ
jgi:pyrroloquinoline quinone (PQQ) biosynthesis protein C